MHEARENFGRAEAMIPAQTSAALNTLGRAAAKILKGSDKGSATKFKEQFLEGANENDLVRSGLDDMMREAYQKVRAAKAENNIPDLRTAAYKVALDRIAISYDSIGL